MLNSLQVKNFRSLEDFEVKKIGRVNLIVGRNNSGKSSVLEALRIYAGNANQTLLAKIAEGHDEKFQLIDEEQDVFNTTLPFEDFFTGREFQEGDDEGIVIGEIGKDDVCLKISHSFLVKEEVISVNDAGEEITRINRRVITNKSEIDDAEDNVNDALVVKKGSELSIIDFSKLRPFQRRHLYLDEKSLIPCSIIPTQFISMNELAKEWDSIALTDGEEIVKIG